MQTLNYTKEQLQQRCEALFTRLEKTPGPGGTPARMGGGGGPEPLPFTSRLKLEMPKTDGTDPLGWLFKEHEYFVFYGVTDEARVPAVSLMLDGPALDWFRWRQRNNLVHTWADFVSQFKLHFDPLSYVDYFGLLSKVRQTGTVLEYQQAFEKVLVNVTAKPTAPAQAAPLLPSPGVKPPPPATTTAGLLVRRLSYAERKARDAKGLCYNCDEKWVKGHSCGRFLLLLEDEKDDEALSPVEDTMLSADVSSLHSLVTVHRSLRLSGMLGVVVVDILIDGGSTHNFFHPSLVSCAQLPVTDIPPFRVYVGNGKSLLCTRQCLNVSLLLQGFHFTVDVYVLPIHGPDMVLGVQWLQLLGRVTHDYANLVMEFTWQDKAISLRGDPISPKPVSLHHLNGLCTGHHIAACYELLISPKPDGAPAEGEHWPTDLPDDIEQVLRQQHSVVRRSSHKLSLRFYCPFEVLERIGPVAYRLKLPEPSRVHPIFHVSVLRHFRRGTNTAPTLPLPLELVDGQTPSVPVKVLGRRRILRPGTPVDQCLVEWSDGGVADATWEPTEVIHQNFPTLHLEDKVVSDGRESVMDSTHQEEPPVRRSAQTRQPPGWQREFEMH
ncbi:unnamed protein product [Cuscuta campestris]|uniref:Uncharacterized protein n=1 Tax=Cuscuta campestris TaxID=132261 RepID=A0A484LB59_9ASTE|nr:unnamed protein product [Cuscuta campestris]